MAARRLTYFEHVEKNSMLFDKREIEAMTTDLLNFSLLLNYRVNIRSFVRKFQIKNGRYSMLVDNEQLIPMYRIKQLKTPHR